ncbi:uncharacterized protein LOC117181256 [Belonocnema kinseyi]|uniref:uncharacterized protein LOC117181256 n=1 Tax=Belonocnema kinseyi TaxID=2817044 RepID=UPI00143D0BEA|nr:uncharacterized protein LOC117181256 [Belonocnema kinseyi]
MVDLPAPSVVAALPFCSTGVDFFGTILIKEKKERNRSFINAYGCVFRIYSENGTNYVRANNVLRKNYILHATSKFKDVIQDYAASKRIEWHFNPPLSPHFRWLCVAAVKSFKHHLNRIMKDRKFTYEQLDTLLKQIADIANSRPLYHISTDPNDVLATTPAHLLIVGPFNFLPEPNFVLVPGNCLKTYQFITKARQDF